MQEGQEVIAPRGVVAANPPQAAQIGARILQAAGNAMDAASAASMACCMLQPMSTGIGGYVCCAVVLEGRTGRLWSVDANSVAPAAAREDMFDILPAQDPPGPINEPEYFCSVRDDANLYGPQSVGVPGMMAGLGIIWERWGKLHWPDIVAPSQQLLEDGFPYALVARSIARMEQVIRRFPATASHLMPEGKLPRPEDIWRRPDMDKTLVRLAAAGWRDFYEGEIGRRIADYIQQAGAILTRQDMAAYAPRLTAPYTIALGDATVSGPILPNGCLTALQILNMLDCLPWPPEDTADYWHAYAEVLKLAWRDRLRYVTDPEFAEVPVARLLSKDYAAGRVETLRQFPRHVDRLTPAPDREPPPETLHVATADAEGNAVSMTISQGYSFGSCVTVPGTGIILGHGMCRFDPRPGRANSIAPGKRPLNNTAPMIVRMSERDVAAGLPGGRKIISVMPRAVQLMVDRGWTGCQAVVAPRMHVETSEPLEISEDVGASVIAQLRAMGHEVKPLAQIAGSMNCAEVLKAESRLRAAGNVSAAGV